LADARAVISLAVAPGMPTSRIASRVAVSKRSRVAEAGAGMGDNHTYV
jgi:hypothetical protein